MVQPHRPAIVNQFNRDFLQARRRGDDLRLFQSVGAGHGGQRSGHESGNDELAHGGVPLLMGLEPHPYDHHIRIAYAPKAEEATT